MAVLTPLAAYTATDDKKLKLDPEGGLQTLIFEITLAGTEDAEDVQPMIRLPFPMRLVGAWCQIVTDLAETCTIDLGMGTYDATAGTVTFTNAGGDADGFVNGFDVEACNDAALAVQWIPLAAGLRNTYTNEASPDLILTHKTGTDISGAYLLRLDLLP